MVNTDELMVNLVADLDDDDWQKLLNARRTAEEKARELEQKKITNYRGMSDIDELTKLLDRANHDGSDISATERRKIRQTLDARLAEVANEAEQAAVLNENGLADEQAKQARIAELTAQVSADNNKYSGTVLDRATRDAKAARRAELESLTKIPTKSSKPIYMGLPDTVRVGGGALIHVNYGKKKDGK
jgi:hypothetical protein